MARLLVASNFHLALDPAEAKLGRPYPPLGTLVTLAAARARGLDVALYDPTFTPSVDTFADALRGHRPERVAIVPDPHAVPQKMCTEGQREAARRMIRMAHEAGARVCVSGPDASDDPARYPEADLVVVGEHDRVVLDWLATGEPAGITPRQPATADLAGLPFPAWDAVDLAAYAAAWRRSSGAWELNLSTTRGCPYRCNWCAKPTWGRTARIRPAAEVAREVRETFDTYRPDRLWFTDDIFGLKGSWLAEYRAALGAPVPFRCLSRADLLVEPQYVETLRAVGCEEVWMGAESGSQRVLDAMDKDQTLAEIHAATALLRRHGIRLGLFLQLGYPGEAYRDVLDTLAMCRELRPDAIGVSLSYPLPGTPFYERVRAELAGDSWAHSMENRLLFRGAYAQEFYDAARALLRDEQAMRTYRPDLSRRGARRAVGAAWHALSWPAHRANLAWQARRGAPGGQSS